MRRKYEYRMLVTKSPEMPVPHRIKVTLPGSIAQTNGTKLSDDTVEFDVTTARRGSSFFAASTGFALSFSGAPPRGANAARAGSMNWLPWIVGVAAALSLGLLGLLWWRRTRPGAAVFPSRAGSPARVSAASRDPAVAPVPPPLLINYNPVGGPGPGVGVLY